MGVIIEKTYFVEFTIIPSLLNVSKMWRIQFFRYKGKTSREPSEAVTNTSAEKQLSLIRQNMRHLPELYLK